MKVFIALAAIILAGFVIGFSIGTLTSPDYSVQANVLQYVYSHINVQFEQGRPIYHFTCGGKSWAYDAASDSVTPGYSSPAAVLRLPKKRNFKSMNLNMMYSIAGGGPTAVIGGIKFVDYLAPLTKNQRVLFVVAAAVTTLSGAYWGYRLGYSDELDCDDDLVQSILNDKKMWTSYATFRTKVPTIGVQSLKH